MFAGPVGSADDKALIKATNDVMTAFGMQHSASHTEFIKCHEDGDFLFSGNSLAGRRRAPGRNGGMFFQRQYVARMGKTGSGRCDGQKIRVAETPERPRRNHRFACPPGSWPDTSQFSDPEIAWRMTGMDHHVGLIVQSAKRERVIELLDDYAVRVKRDYHASAPPPSKPGH